MDDEEQDETYAMMQLGARKTFCLCLFSIGIVMWLVGVFTLNDYLYNATHMSLFPGISTLTLMEVLIGFCLYTEFNKWVTKFTEDDEI